MRGRSLLYAVLFLCAAGDVWLLTNVFLDGHTGIVVCPSKLIYNVSCPGCGVTRACVRILQGNIEGGVFMNPNSLIILFLMLAAHMAVVFDLLSGRNVLEVCMKTLDAVLHNRIIVIFFFITELLIAIRNNILGI